jgi:hypothetical protein
MVTPPGPPLFQSEMHIHGDDVSLTASILAE